MRRVILPILFMVGTASAATLEPAEPGLGQRALLKLEAAPADSTEWPVGLDAAVRPTADPRVFEVVPLRVGEVAVALPSTGDTLRIPVPGTIEDPDPASLRPLFSVGPLRPDWTPTIAILGGVFALLAAALWWWFRRRRRDAIDELPPPEPADVVALRELDRLERAGLVEEARFEEFYVRGSHILRDYAGRRFGLDVLDWTTSETLDVFRSLPALVEHGDRIAPLLRAADEVKFARHRPEAADATWWIREARAFVDETRQPEPIGPTDAGPGSGREVAEVTG